MTRQPLRVLFLTWDYPPSKGGIQIWMFELARGLPDARVTVLAPDAAGAAAFDARAGVHVRRLSGASVSQFVWLVQLVWATLLESLIRRPDLIVCGHVVTGPAALVARKLLGVRYTVFTHAFEIRRQRHRRLVTAVLRSASLVMANSRFTRESVRSHGVPPERIRIVYPGAEERAETAVGTIIAERRADGPVMLSVSRLVDLYKGHDTVIRALPLIRAKCPGASYVVVGGGRLREFLERLADSLGVRHAVRFEGEVTDARLAELYRACDVFVQLSREARTGGGAEGFGIVCLEASLAGKPVVAGRSGGLPDAVDDGSTGVLVDPMDLGAVADAVVTILQDRPAAERMGRDGRARVLREFTWEHMVQAARELFAEAARA
ncbi:MAG TPA: glycosyltransferase family 4 protein [Vicinamibacterales bacterium]|nr:glycosyltransferase family 4 protein [Vicinamibacterales bacterium]